jgi:two-component system sensor histidine kinase AgrC
MLIVFMILICICKHKYTAREIIIGFIFTHLIGFSIALAASYIPKLSSGFDILGNLAICICLTVFIYRKTRNILQSGYYAMFTMIIFMIGNTLAGVMVRFIFNAVVAGTINRVLLVIVTGVLSILLCYVLSKFAGNRLLKSYTQLSSHGKEKFIIYGFILSALTYLLSNFNVFAYRVLINNVMLSSINIVVIATIFGVSVVYMSAYSRGQQMQPEVEHINNATQSLERYVQNLGQAYEEIRSYRHDYFNLLHSIMGFTDCENIKGLRQYLSETMAYTDEIVKKLDDSMEMLNYIRIPELRGLLSVKFAQAHEQGIKTEVDLEDVIVDIPINRMDLCRLVGIMVDNAIEELQKGEYENKILKFGILLDDCDILIVCRNTCNTSPPTDEIFSKGYSTKGNDRGLGLYNLKQISNKCGNVLVTAETNNNEFSLILTILK